MAGFKEETRQIGPHTVKVTQLAAKEGRPLLWRLGQIGGASLGALMGPKSGKATIGAAAVQGLLSGVEWSVVEEIADVLGSKSECTSSEGMTIKLDKPAMRDTAFGVRYLDYFEWLALAIEVNYKDFFTELVARIGAKPAEASPSP